MSTDATPHGHDEHGHNEHHAHVQDLTRHGYIIAWSATVLLPALLLWAALVAMGQQSPGVAISLVLIAGATAAHRLPARVVFLCARTQPLFRNHCPHVYGGGRAASRRAFPRLLARSSGGRQYRSSRCDCGSVADAPTTFGGSVGGTASRRIDCGLAVA